MIYSLKKHLLARNKAACVRVFSTTNSQSPIFTLTLTFIFTFVHMAWFASPPHLWRIKMQKRVCSWKNCKAPLRYFRFFFLFSISNCGCGLNCQLLRRAACFMNLHIFTIFRASVPRRLCVRFNHLIREPLNWLWLWWIMQTIDVRCAMCDVWVLQEMGIGWSSSCLKSFVQRCLARKLKGGVFPIRKAHID